MSEFIPFYQDYRLTRLRMLGQMLRESGQGVAADEIEEACRCLEQIVRIHERRGKE